MILPREVPRKWLPGLIGYKLRKLFFRPFLFKGNFYYRLIKILLLVVMLGHGLHNAPMAHAARTYTDEDLKREEREVHGLPPRRGVPLRSTTPLGEPCNCGKANEEPIGGNINISFTIAAAFTAYIYSQVDVFTVITSFTGFLQGFATNLKITLYPRSFGFIVVPFDFALYGGSDIRYESNLGHINASTTTHADTALIAEVRSLVGPTFFFANHYRINFLVGAGYKYTRNNTMDDKQFSRQHQYFYLPLAAQFEYSEDIFSILFHGEYDIFVNAIASVNIRELTAIPAGRGVGYEYVKANFRIPQTSGYGARGYVEIKIDNFSITPFFNYLWIDSSQPSGGQYVGVQTGYVYPPGTAYFHRPKNSTIETGIKIGYQF